MAPARLEIIQAASAMWFRVALQLGNIDKKHIFFVTIWEYIIQIAKLFLFICTFILSSMSVFVFVESESEML